MLSLLLAAQVAAPNCDAPKDPIASSQCALNDSIKSVPEANCEDQQTQLDLNVCSYRDYLRADIELNRLWAAATTKAKEVDGWEVEHHSKGGRFNRLLDAQRKWIAFRDAQCAFEAGPREDGGTIWALVTNVCMKKTIDARSTWLREYLEPDYKN